MFAFWRVQYLKVLDGFGIMDGPGGYSRACAVRVMRLNTEKIKKAPWEKQGAIEIENCYDIIFLEKQN